MDQTPKRPPGRPSSLTAEIIEQVARELAADDCPTRRAVVSELGIDEAQFSRWMRRGEEKLAERKSKSLHAQLVIAVRKSEAKAQRGIHRYMVEAGRDKNLNDRPMRWLATVRWPDQYREKQPKEQVAEGPEWAKEIDLVQVIDALEEKLQSFLGADESLPAPASEPTP